MLYNYVIIIGSYFKKLFYIQSQWFILFVKMYHTILNIEII